MSEAGNDRGRRLAFAVPAIERESLDIDTSLPDPADPDDRALLIRAAHPELDIDEETAVIGDREINPRLHLTLHEIVATQLADDDPPEVWAAAVEDVVGSRQRTGQRSAAAHARDGRRASSDVGCGGFVEEAVQDRAQEHLEFRSVIQRQAIGSLVSHRETLARVERSHGDIGVTIGIRGQLANRANAGPDALHRCRIDQLLRSGREFGHPIRISL